MNVKINKFNGLEKKPRYQLSVLTYAHFHLKRVKKKKYSEKIVTLYADFFYAQFDDKVALDFHFNVIITRISSINIQPITSH